MTHSLLMSLYLFLAPPLLSLILSPWEKEALLESSLKPGVLWWGWDVGAWRSRAPGKGPLRLTQGVVLLSALEKWKAPPTPPSARHFHSSLASAETLGRVRGCQSLPLLTTALSVAHLQRVLERSLEDLQI